MAEIFRTRDCVVFSKGDAYTVMTSAAMLAAGWPGGQGVRWIDSPQDEFLVTYSDGLYGGFFLWGSNESSDQYTAMTGQQAKYGYATFCAGNWILSTSTYERYTYLSRTGGGPLVPLVYVEGMRLRFSLRGYFTIEDEWTLALDPRAPNNYYIANVVQAPSAVTDDYLTVQTSI